MQEHKQERQQHHHHRCLFHVRTHTAHFDTLQQAFEFDNDLCYYPPSKSAKECKKKQNRKIAVKPGFIAGHKLAFFSFVVRCDVYALLLLYYLGVFCFFYVLIG